MAHGNSIYLAANGHFHAFSLASEYAKLNLLGGLYAADQHFVPPHQVSPAMYHNRWDLKLWRIGAQWSGMSFGYTAERDNRFFDEWLSHRLSKLPGGIFHGWNTHVGRTLRRLDPEKWLRCVERSCPHNLIQYHLLVEEGARLDLPYVVDMNALAAAVQELYDADVIVAPSRYSASSYDEPVLKAKVRINSLGANFPYRERPSKKKDPLRVLLVGNRFLRKGTHYLVEAFKLIRDPHAELWIRGDVPLEYRKRITDSRVRIIPAVSFRELNRLYREATLFCLPSVDEGFGMVALEAISHGLPLIYTDHCGVADILSSVVGRQVPIRSPEAIAAAIEELHGWTEEDDRQFDLARRDILAMNSWGNCVKRMLSSVYVREAAPLAL